MCKSSEDELKYEVPAHHTCQKLPQSLGEFKSIQFQAGSSKKKAAKKSNPPAKPAGPSLIHGSTGEGTGEGSSSVEALSKATIEMKPAVVQVIS